MDGKTMQQIRDGLIVRWRKIGNRDFEFRVREYGETSQTEIIDIAQTLEQIGRDASLQEAERRELLAIERALGKMATGNFGICEDCSEEIPSKRLLVLPEARLCAQCQAFEEKQGSRMRFYGNQ